MRVCKCGSFCEQGVRGNNEDFVIPGETGGRIYVLCDGMGGHGHGEVASEVVGTSVARFLEENLRSGECAPELLQEALDFAVERLNEADEYQDERRMGTTVVAVVVNEDGVLVGHVGDSRCYLLDESGSKKFRTKDHSLVAEAVENEILTEEEAFNSPKKNVLTRSVQAGKEGRIEMTVDVLGSEDLKDGDMLLLCSDGVNDALRDTEIEAVMSEGTPEERLNRLREECANKSRDNYSAILLRVEKETEARPEPPRGAGLRRCPHCGAVISENDEEVCEEDGRETDRRESQPEDNKNVFREDYFGGKEKKEAEEYFEIFGMRIKKKAYVAGSLGVIVVLLIVCAVLSTRLARSGDGEGKGSPDGVEAVDTLREAVNDEKNEE